MSSFCLNMYPQTSTIPLPAGCDLRDATLFNPRRPAGCVLRASVCYVTDRCAYVYAFCDGTCVYNYELHYYPCVYNYMLQCCACVYYVYVYVFYDYAQRPNACKAQQYAPIPTRGRQRKHDR